MRKEEHNLPKVEEAVVGAAVPLCHEAQSHGYPLPCCLPQPILKEHQEQDLRSATTIG